MEINWQEIFTEENIVEIKKILEKVINFRLLLQVYS